MYALNIYNIDKRARYKQKLKNISTYLWKKRD